MGGKVRILLIDDDQDFVVLVKTGLEKTGRYEVMAASGGEDGLLLARSRSPDLILLDLVMPEVSGSEVAEELLENVLTRHIPIVFLTSLVQRGDMCDEGFIGGRRFIAKPIAPVRLAEKIDRLLSSAQGPAPLAPHTP